MTATPLKRTEEAPRRLGDFETIADALDYAATGTAGLNFYTQRGEFAQSLSYGELRERALSVASKLLAVGLRPGDRVALVAETSVDFPVCFFACQYAGIVPCPAPAETNVLAPDAYLGRIARMLEACGASALITSQKVPDDIRAMAPLRALTYAQLYAQPEGPFSRQQAAPEHLAYIQFSSGSTTQPKGILISQAALSANVASILRDGIRLTASDRAFSWLPFYHDMGLVGLLLAPLAGQCNVDYLAPSAFARRPALWLQLMSDIGSTISYAPTFGYRLVADRLRNSDLHGIDLSRWRVAGIGGDMIRMETLDQFALQFEPIGFDRKAFVPSYGLAEATLAVTFANEETGPKTACPDTRSADTERHFVVCGRPLPGYDVRIVDAFNVPVTKGTVGHVTISGPSLMQGYAVGQDESSVQRDGGYFDTGDLGFLVDGALAVTGRAKDLMLVNGRNLWPADIEWVVQQEADIRYGHTVAFSVPEPPGPNPRGAEHIVVLVEYRSQKPRDELRALIAGAVSNHAGIAVEIVFVPPQTISMTSSGKLKRSAARDAFVAGTLETV